MVAMACFLSMGFTACSDDDNNNNSGENMEQLESTGGEVSMEDIQLSTLISNFAEAMLRELGIDGSNPSGFTFTSASVGTVSYQHGGGTDANTLAVINLDVRQLPGISQLRMVKALPANISTPPTTSG